MNKPQANFYLCHIRWNSGDAEFFVVLANDIEQGKLRAARALLEIYGEDALSESKLVNIKQVGLEQAQRFQVYKP